MHSSATSAFLAVTPSLDPSWRLFATSVSLHLEGLSAEGGEDSREGRGRREQHTTCQLIYTCTCYVYPIMTSQTMQISQACDITVQKQHNNVGSSQGTHCICTCVCAVYRINKHFTKIHYVYIVSQKPILAKQRKPCIYNQGIKPSQ